MSTIPDEQVIKDYFAKLPRKSFGFGEKEKIWLTIQNHMREARLAIPEKKSFFSWPVFAFGRMTLTIFLVVVVAGLVGGATKASEGSIPGDKLYTVKKAAEQVEKVLATSDSAKVKVGIKHATRRLEEVRVLVAENKRAEVVSQTLEDLRTVTEQVVTSAEAAEPELRQEAVQLVSKETEVLSLVKAQAKEDVREAFQDAINATHKSISKLQGGNSGIEGVSTTASTTAESDNSTSTAQVSPAVKPLAKPKVQDGILESNIQIDAVIKFLDETDSQKSGPKILDNPTTDF